MNLIYIAACIIVPAVWGLVVSLAFEARDRRRNADAAGESKEMYYI